MDKQRNSVCSPPSAVRQAVESVRQRNQPSHSKVVSFHDFSFRGLDKPQKPGSRYARTSLNKSKHSCESNKENQRELLNQTEACRLSRRKSASNRDFSQFTLSSLQKTASLVNKTLIDYYMSFSLAKQGLRKLEKRFLEDVQALEWFKHELVEKITTEFNAVFERMREDEGEHRSILKALEDKATRGYEQLLGYRKDLEKLRACDGEFEAGAVHDKVDEVRNHTHLLAVQLDGYRDAQSKQVSVEALRDKREFIVEKIMTVIFDELNLSSQEAPVFLVATDRLTEEQPDEKKASTGFLPLSTVTASRASSRDSYKLGIGEKLKHILRRVSLEREEARQQSGSSLSRTLNPKQPVEASGRDDRAHCSDSRA